MQPVSRRYVVYTSFVDRYAALEQTRCIVSLGGPDPRAWQCPGAAIVLRHVFEGLVADDQSRYALSSHRSWHITVPRALLLRPEPTSKASCRIHHQHCLLVPGRKAMSQVMRVRLPATTSPDLRTDVGLNYMFPTR